MDVGVICSPFAVVTHHHQYRIEQALACYDRVVLVMDYADVGRTRTLPFGPAERRDMLHKVIPDTARLTIVSQFSLHDDAIWAGRLIKAVRAAGDPSDALFLLGFSPLSRMESVLLADPLLRVVHQVPIDVLAQTDALVTQLMSGTTPDELADSLPEPIIEYLSVRFRFFQLIAEKTKDHTQCRSHDPP